MTQGNKKRWSTKKIAIVAVAVVAGGIALAWGAGVVLEDVAADSRDDATSVKVSTMAHALDHYYLGQRTYPEDLMSAFAPGTMSRQDLLDSWGRLPRYMYSDRSYEICSAGPDGLFDTADDICRRRERRQR